MNPPLFEWCEILTPRGGSTGCYAWHHNGRRLCDHEHDYEDVPSSCEDARVEMARIRAAAVTPTDREILEALCVDDPWAHSWEGLDDCCLFCGSGTQEYGTVEGVKYWHDATCAWMKAVTHLGRSHGIHGYLDDRPKPPPVKPCPVCAANPNATLDSHMTHLSREWITRMLRKADSTERHVYQPLHPVPDTAGIGQGPCQYPGCTAEPNSPTHGALGLGLTRKVESPNG